ncbi:hypothetical protein BKA64DRAFT_161033 [Cadophora sp. MPI-SDFR-AT-0126]|nr:hypothetical protein BKA64DRAFT_161033 [Leotiomycetes sp. MPI-SDFR-AT-0126]
MPHKSVQAAEKAAIEGETEEWDTQQCRALNSELEALLSSSPNRASDNHNQVASSNRQVAVPTFPQRPVEKQEQHESQLEVGIGADGDPDVIVDLSADGNGNLAQLDRPTTADDELNHPPADNLRPLQIRRDSRGRLRTFAPIGEEARPAQFGKNYQMAQVRTAMDDFTQRSSMSATQENPRYLYDQFNIQQNIREDCPSTATPNDDSESEDQGPEPPVHDPKHASASTAYTYQENDTGHIHLGFDTEPIEEEPLEQSQDGAYAMPMPAAQPSYSSFEPKTPAPPVNPFQQKGSVMKGFELFGATQPSSIARHMVATPTSSRPSPNVYNDFSSPPKRRVSMLSSPLRRGPPEPESEINDATPLQSSVRDLLGRSQSSRNAQSFDTGPSGRSAWTNPEPRPYVSMQESQEKRRRTIEPDFESSGDDSDMETPRNRNRKTERELQIQRELAKVGLRKRTPSTNPRSSAPPSSTAAIEVPSTGRRRSFQDDYITQCTGQDARDTQQDDVIVDSQAAEIEAPEPEQPDSSKQQQEATDPSVSDPRKAREEVGQQADADATQNTNSSNLEPDPDPDPEPSLPLQEMSSNLGVRTPGSRLQSDVVDTVPETSPPEDRLRPMGEIASISFGASEELPENFPGFTQDLEFENAMQIRTSPRPPTGIRSFGKTPKASMASGSGSGSPIVNPVLSVTSSALSSPPSSAILEEVAAEVSLHDEPSEEPRDNEIARDEAPDHRSDLPTDAPNGNVDTGSHPGSALNATPTTSVTPTPADVTRNQLQKNEVATASTSSLPNEPPNQTPKRILRTYSKLKGPSRNLRRSLDVSASTNPLQSSPVSKLIPVPKATAPSHSTPVRKATNSKQLTPLAIPNPPSASFAAVSKRTGKRKSGVTVVQDDSIQPTRTSKRQSQGKDLSPDPLALSSPTAAATPKAMSGLFKEMTFAVSYVAHEREKDEVTKAIFEQGGRILPDGFDSLFDSTKVDKNEELSLSPSAKSVRFVALIADEHSRKAKYMQALALGLPCISGHWITTCVAKNTTVDWSPYLLCAGQSSILGNAHKSRVLQPYPAQSAKLEDTFASRGKLLEGKSVLLVTGKGKGSEKRKAYTFLAHALGPARISQVVDYQDARKKLLEEEGWDLLYVDTHEKSAAEAIFGTPTVSSSASRKRKRGSIVVDDPPAPKKVRIITDETMIQSLILGQLLDD